MSFKDGDYILLWLNNKNTYLVRIKRGAGFSTHKGKVSFDDIIGKIPGDVVSTHLGHEFILLEPTPEDFLRKVKRRTQIIYPKDAAIITFKLGIHVGSRVIETGTGSGALTIALANAVAPTGKVYTYDKCEDFVNNAVKNVSMAGLDEFVEFNHSPVESGFGEKDVDAVVLDLPSPWVGLPPATNALKGGGRLASISPTFNQVERMANALDEGGFVYVETLEVLIRTILAREGKTRPYERMVGHTGFITFARKTNK